jgi:hypothetical protein
MIIQHEKPLIQEKGEAPTNESQLVEQLIFADLGLQIFGWRPMVHNKVPRVFGVAEVHQSLPQDIICTPSVHN